MMKMHLRLHMLFIVVLSLAEPSVCFLRLVLPCQTIRGTTPQRASVSFELSPNLSSTSATTSHWQPHLVLFSSTNNEADISTDWLKVGLYETVAILYWYLMVLGSLVASKDLPVPEWLPLIPGWPPSDADLKPVLEDSQHFFYLSELLGKEDAPYVNPVRLAAFNFPEAWIFGMLPVLWKDPRRLNKWALLTTWALLGINLTNAFLAPYLLVTELNTASSPDDRPKNVVFSALFGLVASAVASYALFQCITVATTQDWMDYSQLVTTDRTYLAFTVDLALFSVFQPLILSRVKASTGVIDYVPFVGLIAWLFQPEDRSSKE